MEWYHGVQRTVPFRCFQPRETIERSFPPISPCEFGVEVKSFGIFLPERHANQSVTRCLRLPPSMHRDFFSLLLAIDCHASHKICLTSALMADHPWTRDANLPFTPKKPRRCLTIRRHPLLDQALNQMRRQQEVRNPLPHVVLVPTVPADELPLHHLRLHEERVQLLEHGLVALQVLRGWRLGGELWEAQLFRTPWGQPQVRLPCGVA